MGALAAAFNKKGEDVVPTVQTMLEELKHRETKPPKIATLNEKTTSKAAGTISSERVLGKNYVCVFEGRIFPPTQTSSVNRILTQSEQKPTKMAGRVLKEFDGSYAFALLLPTKVLVGRDSMGTSPLYYGENEFLCAVAPERKALWKIGVHDAYSFPPGNLGIMSQSGFAFEPVSTLKQPTQSKLKMHDAAKRLQKLLEESTQERTSDVEKVGVAFSGGLDSSIVAVLAKLTEVPVHLIAVGLEGQREIESAKEAAKTLELPLTLQKFTVADVEKVISKVLWLIEEPNIMKVGIAIPFYWTAEIASKLGCHVLLAGQGADELFGGYHRYLMEYAKGGTEKVREALYRDTAMSYETNFQRDEPVCTFHRVELRLPFADREVVRFALSLPPNLKIESARDPLRKKVLRQVAKNLGIPVTIADKPKKAVQFASGVDKALKKLAEKEGLTTRSYVEKVFREVYSNMEVKVK